MLLSLWQWYMGYVCRGNGDSRLHCCFVLLVMATNDIPGYPSVPRPQYQSQSALFTQGKTVTLAPILGFSGNVFYNLTPRAKRSELWEVMGWLCFSIYNAGCPATAVAPLCCVLAQISGLSPSLRWYSPLLKGHPLNSVVPPAEGSASQNLIHLLLGLSFVMSSSL